MRSRVRRARDELLAASAATQRLLVVLAGQEQGHEHEHEHEGSLMARLAQAVLATRRARLAGRRAAGLLDYSQRTERGVQVLDVGAIREIIADGDFVACPCGECGPSAAGIQGLSDNEPLVDVLGRVLPEEGYCESRDGTAGLALAFLLLYDARNLPRPGPFNHAFNQTLCHTEATVKRICWSKFAMSTGIWGKLGKRHKVKAMFALARASLQTRRQDPGHGSEVGEEGGVADMDLEAQREADAEPAGAV